MPSTTITPLDAIMYDHGKRPMRDDAIAAPNATHPASWSGQNDASRVDADVVDVPMPHPS
jgi:hypothetical protein